MHFINELTSSSKLPCVTNVESLLLLALTDQAGKSKQQSMLFQYMVWMYQNDLAYTCPDRFQHACVFVKYALKCTAFRRMQHFKKAREDKKFVDAHFRDNDCAFQEIEFMKKLARRCYCYVKPEKIRWLNPGVLQVNTKGTIWITVQLVQIKNMISRQLDIVENIFAVLGIPVITSEEMQTVKDTDNIGIGHGVWTLNKHLRTKFVKVQDAQEFLMHDTKLGVALGFACSYSGGGAMRVPEVNEISFTRLTSGSVRSLRFSNGPLGGRCALAYDYTKMDNLVGAEASLSIQTTMKFTFERLSRLMLTHAIRFKPQAISVAMHEFGRRGAMCHGSMLAVEKGDRMSDDSLRYQFNAIIDEAVPGVSVASMRHVIEAVSLQAADGTQTKIQAREDMRQAMIALSAHSARTSDGRYAGDQYQLAGMPGFHVEKYHRAALAFNAHIGLELQVTQDMDDFMHAAWAWIKEFRPEVATASLHAVQGKGWKPRQKQFPILLVKTMRPCSVNAIHRPGPVQYAKNEGMTLMESKGLQYTKHRPRSDCECQTCLKTPLDCNCTLNASVKKYNLKVNNPTSEVQQSRSSSGNSLPRCLQVDVLPQALRHVQLVNQQDPARPSSDQSKLPH